MMSVLVIDMKLSIYSTFTIHHFSLIKSYHLHSSYDDQAKQTGEELISVPIKMPDCHNCATKKTNHPHEGHLLLIIKCFLSGTSSTVLSAEKLIMVRLGLVWFSLG